MKKTISIIAITLAFISFVACTTVQEHRDSLRSTQEREITVGTVQKEIKKGMSGAEVAEALGSPNIVTKDEDGKETWVYDKIATEVSYSQGQSAMFLILGGVSNQSGAASVTQKTLTVVIKFDPNSKVSSFTYHASKF
jgi:outer membrane protein assembly factor BamE (lipoprotein component of BamABCDE complex)